MIMIRKTKITIWDVHIIGKGLGADRHLILFDHKVENYHLPNYAEYQLCNYHNESN